MKRSRTIVIDLDDYIDMLEARRREIAENFNWTIPDGVWDYFIEDLEDGYGLGDDTRPNYVVDNIATNGNFGPVENYALLDKMVQSVIEDAAGEGITLSEDEAKDQLADLSFDGLHDIAKDADEEGAIFFYAEPDSDYVLGVCYWLLR